MTATGWTIFLAAIGVMAGLLGHEVTGFHTWSEGFTPAFVGKALIHFGSVVGAFVGGKLIPTERPVWSLEQRAAKAADEVKP